MAIPDLLAGVLPVVRLCAQVRSCCEPSLCSGWKAIGYPGPRHEFGGYTPEQMIGEAPIQTAWGSEID